MRNKPIPIWGGVVQLTLTRPLNQSAERMAKETLTSIVKKLTHWLSEFVLSGAVLGVGVYLVIHLPVEKQRDVDMLIYKGPATYGVIFLGALGMLNSVRRALFKKKES